MRDAFIEITEEHLQFLDDLRESGDIKMFGAAPYVQEEFDITREQARFIVAHWMYTFEERHPPCR